MQLREPHAACSSGLRDPGHNGKSGGAAQEVYGKLEEPDGLAGLLRLRTGGPRLQDQARMQLCVTQPPSSCRSASGKHLHLTLCMMLYATTVATRASLLIAYD